MRAIALPEARSKQRVANRRSKRSKGVNKWAFLTAALLVGFIVFKAQTKPRTMTNTTEQSTVTSQTSAIEVSPTPETVGTPENAVADTNEYTVIVNKRNALPREYAPEDLVEVDIPRSAQVYLRREAGEAAKGLFAAAEQAGYTLRVFSAFRSYQEQAVIYQNYVDEYGILEADTFSARPGHSEHQTGLAVDISYEDGSYELAQEFGETEAGDWLEKTAPNFGYLVRYPRDKEVETGYQYEPWHIRYVGVGVAKAVVASGKTLDQYFNVEAGDYSD